MWNFRIIGQDDPDLEQLAAMFKALSNPHRLRIFTRLSSRCTPGVSTCDADMRCCVGDISDRLEIAPSTVSHHMKELRTAGLIRMERNGQETDCWVEPKVLEMLSRFFGERVRKMGCP
jgi:ArsR family transcriptional regulator